MCVLCELQQMPQCARTEMYDCWEEGRQMKEGWKCVWGIFMEQCVTSHGAIPMQLWYAANWGFQGEVSRRLVSGLTCNFRTLIPFK